MHHQRPVLSALVDPHPGQNHKHFHTSPLPLSASSSHSPHSPFHPHPQPQHQHHRDSSPRKAYSSATFSRFRAVLFNDLLDTNLHNRAAALDNIVRIVTEWARVVTANSNGPQDGTSPTSLSSISGHHGLALLDVGGRPRSFSNNMAASSSNNNSNNNNSGITGSGGNGGNPTPPFSPASRSQSVSSMSGEHQYQLLHQQHQHTRTLSQTLAMADQQSLAFETLSISTQPLPASPIPSSANDTVSPTSPTLAAFAGHNGGTPHHHHRHQHHHQHSTSSSSSFSSSVASASMMDQILTAGHNGSSSGGYHFQNDPDIHFNRELPDKLSPTEEHQAEVDEAARMLRHHILTILRFSRCCPYKDVKRRLWSLLLDLEALGILIPKPIHHSASFFIEPKDIFLLDSPDVSRTVSPLLSPRIGLTDLEDPDPQSLSLLDDHAQTQTTVTGTSFDRKRSLSVTQTAAYGCTPDAATREIIARTFLKHGRASNFFRILAYFPTFWERFELSQVCMMSGPGPIPKAWRCYVALMAASQFNCQYLVSMMKLDYLTSGGDPTWLNGLQYTTQKIRNLAKLNGLMAHQPWLLKPRHIQELVNRDDRQNPHNVWTISELAQVMVILSTIHSMSLFVSSCGIVPEIDMIGGTVVDVRSTLAPMPKESNDGGMLPSPDTDEPPPPPQPHPQSNQNIGRTFDTDFYIRPVHAGVGLPPATFSTRTFDEATTKMHTQELIQRLLNAQNGCATDDEEGYSDSEHAESDSGALPKGFEECQDTFPAPVSEPASTSTSPPTSSSPSATSSSFTSPASTASDHALRPVQEDMSRFLDLSCQVEPALFQCHAKGYSVFRVEEFRWEDDGSPLLTRYLPELCEGLEDEFSEAMNFTDQTFFKGNQDRLQQQAQAAEAAALGESAGQGPKESAPLDQEPVDTFPFREAVWYYTLRLFGVLNQDYDYRKLAQFTNTTLRAYITKVCHGFTNGNINSNGDQDSASPFSSPALDNGGSGTFVGRGTGARFQLMAKVDRNDFENMGFELRSEERCHINVLIMEASKQAKLLYALRAIHHWEQKTDHDEEDGEDETL